MWESRKISFKRVKTEKGVPFKKKQRGFSRKANGCYHRLTIISIRKLPFVFI